MTDGTTIGEHMGAGRNAGLEGMQRRKKCSAERNAGCGDADKVAEHARMHAGDIQGARQQAGDWYAVARRRVRVYVHIGVSE